ncbi:MAG: hypothetical protein JSW45_06170, partial [Thiotrichales bacterium]
MRLISYFSGLLALLILAGSVAAARQTVPDGDLVVQADLDSDYCAVDRLVSSGLDDADQHDSSLNPERISMLNWNIYKGQR